MTILEVKKAWSRSGANATTQDGQTLVVSFEEAYQITHSADATEMEIMSASGLPGIATRHPETYAICKRIGPLSRVSPIYSIVGVGYEGQFGPGQLTASPINKGPEYIWSDTTSNEPIDCDWDGKPIATKNGEPLRGLTMELADQTLTVTRNFALFSPWLTHQYRHSVNSDSFASYPAGTARLVGFSATREYSDTFAYWKVNAKIQFRYPYNVTPDKAWYARVRHEGYYERLTVDGVDRVVRAVDKNKEPVTNPVPLKEDGTRFTQEEIDRGESYWLLFKRYQPLPYSALGLL